MNDLIPLRNSYSTRNRYSHYVNQAFTQVKIIEDEWVWKFNQYFNSSNFNTIQQILKTLFILFQTLINTEMKFVTRYNSIDFGRL